MDTIREPAVAGPFYAREPDELATTVAALPDAGAVVGYGARSVSE